MRLSGRIALITGGASGIGYCSAVRFAREGASVAIADMDADAGMAVVEEIAAENGKALFYNCDVTDESQVRQAVEATREDFGGLHLLVTSAGILQGAFQQVEQVDVETFERVLNVNVLGTFLACKHATPVIEASGGGVILCLSSGAGVRGPSSSLAYGSSKSGVQGFAVTLEKQLAPRGIRVNLVCPGSLDTPMKRQNIRDLAIHAGRDPDDEVATTQLGDPDGIAKILAFLASSDADYVIGQVHTR
jgi:NAD(P)-dependent dehydrogenase (short-subunit alcohol dehydrogenase family)